MIEAALSKLLKGTTAIAAAATGGVHIAERPETFPLPCLVIGPSFEEKDHHFEGATGTARGTVPVTALAGSALQTRDLLNLVRLRLDGLDGVVTIKDDAGADLDFKLEYLLHDGEAPIPSDHRDGEGRIRTHGRRADFAYAITESLPTLTS